MKPSAPCLGCKERELHCHSRCEIYIDYKNKMQVHHDAREKFLKEEDEFMKAKVRKK